jgi:hypothetical protein
LRSRYVRGVPSIDISNRAPFGLLTVICADPTPHETSPSLVRASRRCRSSHPARHDPTDYGERY